MDPVRPRLCKLLFTERCGCTPICRRLVEPPGFFGFQNAMEGEAIHPKSSKIHSFSWRFCGFGFTMCREVIALFAVSQISNLAALLGVSSLEVRFRPGCFASEIAGFALKQISPLMVQPFFSIKVKPTEPKSWPFIASVPSSTCHFFRRPSNLLLAWFL